MKRMRFRTWCRKDEDDERKINYTFTESDGNVMEFTSDDFLPFSYAERVGNAWIKSIELRGGEWYADLYEGA